jgi:hypothetical protein
MATPRQRRFLPAIALVVVTLTACGDDSASDITTPPAATDAANTTATPDTSTTSSSAAPTSTPSTPAPVTTAPGTISVTVGVDSGPDRVEQVALGTEVTLVLLNPDADDEFHLHGFDLGGGATVPAGQMATFVFTADQAGSFELESHVTDEVYLVLEVS